MLTTDSRFTTLDLSMLPRITSQLNALRQQAGFTMIELLVVISVIGVLAVAVLSSLNPIEQINKGRDTRTQSDAAQLINALDRYFAIQEEYPWNTQTDDWDAGSVVTDYESEVYFDEAGTSSVPTNGTNLDSWDWMIVLQDTAEVKAGFVNRLTSDENVDYVLYKPPGANATVHVCFFPSSNAFDQEASARCNEDGVDDDIVAVSCPAGCADDFTDETQCLVCLP